MITLVILILAMAVSFFYGLFSGNYSTVDRLWSILPPVYVLIWGMDYTGNPGYIIAGSLVILWGIRLSVNFGLKGGYAFSFSRGFTGEDYRWEVLRARIGSRFLFELFNLFFISIFQLALIFLFTLPLYYYGRISDGITSAEVFLFALHFLLLLVETLADIQQYRFHGRKRRSPWRDMGRYGLGFNTFGFWKYSRHPNYLCEMGQWIVVYGYLHLALRQIHFTGLGALILILLFAGSTRMAEGITASKYPDYSQWQRLSSVWIPFSFFCRRAQRTEFLDRFSKSESLKSPGLEQKG